MMKTIVTCASALFLVACSGDSPKAPAGTPPAANANVAANAKVELLLGEDI